MKTKKNLLRVFLIFTLFTMDNTNGNEENKDIIRKIVNAYSSLDSYQDKGYIEEKVIFNSKETKLYIPFEIYFLRPNFLKVKWKAQLFPNAPYYGCVLCSNGTKTFTYWEIGKFEKMKSIKDGIYANSGVSHGSTATVPSLLIGIRSLSLDLEDITSILMTKEEEFDKTECFYLKVKDKRGKVYELWIGKRDYLLRKLKRTLIHGSAEEVHQYIKVNNRINSEIFNCDFKRNQ